MATVCGILDCERPVESYQLASVRKENSQAEERVGIGLCQMHSVRGRGEGHWWLRCGNCGRLLTSDESIGVLAHDYAEHMKHGHSGNWHIPQGGYCDENERRP